MHHKSNLEGNLTYMGEEESNGSFWTLGARFPDIYDTNDEDAMKPMKKIRFECLHMTYMTCNVYI